MKLLVVLALVATLSLIDAKPRPDSLVVDFQQSQASRRVSDYVKECEDGKLTYSTLHVLFGVIHSNVMNTQEKTTLSR